MANNVNDLFDQLFGFEWRGVNFPCAGFEVDLSQDHAEHKWPDRDGAHIEATGRNPLVFTARALFRNGTAPGKNESFQDISTNALYPFVYRKFLTACADRTSGPLKHPELGTLKVKCKSARSHWDANKRDGVDVDVVWIESTDTAADLTKVLASPSPIGTAMAFAADLDDQISNYPGLAASLKAKALAAQIAWNVPAPLSFTDLIRVVQGAIDQASLLSKQIAGKIDEVAYRLNSLSDTVSAAKDVQAWPIVQSIEHLRSATEDLRTQLLVATKTISLYLVKRPQTLSSVCGTLGASIADLIKLNPNAASISVIPENTVIRYYTDATGLANGG